MSVNKVALAKRIARLTVGAGTTTVSNSIIKNNVDFDDLNLPRRVSVAVASVVIGMMASDKTKVYTDAKIDATIKSWNESKQKNETESTSE